MIKKYLLLVFNTRIKMVASKIIKNKIVIKVKIINKVYPLYRETLVFTPEKKFVVTIMVTRNVMNL